ncbi:MAG: sugar isomerase domain-containing protein [Armatimonadota bacterium]
MLAERYAEAVRDLTRRIEDTQMERIDEAARAISEALVGGGAFWVYNIGHGGERELTHRAGGLLATKIFSFGFNVSSPIAECRRGRPRPEPVEPDLAQVRLAVRASEMRSGDVLMVASVSGRTRRTVELARAASETGVTVIGLTSLEYTEQIESDHPSGKRLCDVANIVIDNCAPFGDACLQAQAYEHRVLPISGVAHIVIGWMICGQVIDRMTQMGSPPHVYMSVNRPGGREYNEQAEREYNQRGY